jgi:hypothetical protein
MKNPADMKSHEFRLLCEKCVKEYNDAHLEVTKRIIAEHGVPFATWISTDAMTRTLATYCMMHSDQASAAAQQIISKFVTNLDYLLNENHRVLPEPTHPAPGVSQ